MSRAAPKGRHILQLQFHVECLGAACSVTARHAADVTVRSGNGQLLRAVRARNAGRSWLVPGFCEKTRHGHDSSGQQVYTGGTPLPARGGQPCPPGIPPIALSAAETARIERLARDWKAGILSLARLAFHLRWSVWRRRHQARARWHHYTARLAILAT